MCLAQQWRSGQVPGCMWLTWEAWQALSLPLVSVWPSTYCCSHVGSAPLNGGFLSPCVSFLSVTVTFKYIFLKLLLVYLVIVFLMCNFAAVCLGHLKSIRSLNHVLLNVDIFHYTISKTLLVNNHHQFNQRSCQVHGDKCKFLQIPIFN